MLEAEARDAADALPFRVAADDFSESAVDARPGLVETRVGIFWISKRYCWDMSLKSCYKAS